jgi:hypothetical protein
MPDNPIVLPAHVFAGFWPRPVAPGIMPVIAARLLAGGYVGLAPQLAAGLAARGDPRSIGSASRALEELAAGSPAGGWLCPARP